MIRAGALVALVLVAGCSKPAPAPTPSASPTFSAPNLAKSSWKTVFGNAGQSLDLFGRVGLRPGEYRKQGDAYVSTATPTPLSDPSGPTPAVANFTARGDKTTLSSISFSLDEPVASSDPQVTQQFDRWMFGTLHQLGTPGTRVVRRALAGKAPATGSLKGADYAVTRTTDKEGRHLAVTFARPGAMPAPTDQGSK